MSANSLGKWSTSMSPTLDEQTQPNHIFGITHFVCVCVLYLRWRGPCINRFNGTVCVCSSIRTQFNSRQFINALQVDAKKMTHNKTE